MIGYYDPFAFAIRDTLRPLIYHYAKDLGNLKSPEENIQSSLGFFKDLLGLPVLEKFKNIQLQSQFNNILSNAKYLAHEYLNQSYESFDLAKLAAELSQAKLQFASPAHFARLLQPSYFLDKATLNKLNKLPLSCKKCSKTCSIEWATKRIISSRIAKRASRF